MAESLVELGLQISPDGWNSPDASSVGSALSRLLDFPGEHSADRPHDEQFRTMARLALGTSILSNLTKNRERHTYGQRSSRHLSLLNLPTRNRQHG